MIFLLLLVQLSPVACIALSIYCLVNDWYVWSSLAGLAGVFLLWIEDAVSERLEDRIGD